jgi:hypothetical protein
MAVFQNTGMAKLKVAFHIRELSKDPQRFDESRTASIPQQTAFLDPGERGDATFRPISQKWLWFAGFVPLEERDKAHTFTYSVVSTIQDEFGNTYPKQTIDLLSVIVRVPHSKYDLVLAADAIYAAWMIVSIAAAEAPLPVNLVLAGIASGLSVTMFALITAAADPPEADLRYRDTVAIVPKPVPKALAAHAYLAPFATFIDVINRILAAHDALTEIHGRLLGARKANDAAGITLQTRSYRDAVEYLVSSAAQLQAATAGVTRIEEIKDLFDVRLTRKQLDRVHRSGVTPAMRRNWSKARLPKNTASLVTAILRDHPLLRWAKGGFTATLASIAPTLMRYAVATREESSSVLDFRPTEATADGRGGAVVLPWKAKPVRNRSRSTRGVAR